MFNIDLTILAISIVGIVAFIVPFFIKHQGNKKTTLKVRQQLNEKLLENQLSVQEEEIWRDRYFLGLDKSKNKLIYIQDISKMTLQIIDLEKISTVSIHETSHHVGDKKNGRTIIDSIHLSIQSKDTSKTLTLEVFNSDYFSDLFGEPVFAKRWKEIIEKQLKKAELVNS